MLWLRVFNPICSTGNKAVWKGTPEGLKKKSNGNRRQASEQRRQKKGRVDSDLGKSKADTSARFGRGGMAFASTRKHVGTAMMALKGAVLPVLLWP